MSRTVPSYRMILEAEIKRWNGFLNALRRKDREAFEELMSECRRYASAAGSVIRSIVVEDMFMSILLSHQKSLKEVQDALEKIKSSQHPEK